MSEGVAIAIATGIIISLCVATAIFTYCFIRCYRNRKYHTNRRVAVIAGHRSAQGIYARAPTSTSDDTTYDVAPPTYIPYTGYQPCPEEAPPPVKEAPSLAKEAKDPDK